MKGVAVRRCMSAEREAARTARIRDMATGGMGWGLRRAEGEWREQWATRRAASLSAHCPHRHRAAHALLVRWSNAREEEGGPSIPCRRSTEGKGASPVVSAAAPSVCLRCSRSTSGDHRNAQQMSRAIGQSCSAPRLPSPTRPLLSAVHRPAEFCLSARDDRWKRETLRTRRAERRVGNRDSTNKQRQMIVISIASRGRSGCQMLAERSMEIGSHDCSVENQSDQLGDFDVTLRSDQHAFLAR